MGIVLRAGRGAAASLVALCAFAFSPEAARAQCAFEHPSHPATTRTGIVDTRLVQAFISSGNCTLCGETSNPPNTTTQGGIPAFGAPFGTPQTCNQTAGSPPNGWTWGDFPGPPSQPSWGRVRLTRITNNTTSLLCPLGQDDVEVKLWLRKITDLPASLASGTGTLNIVLRATLNDPGTGDMTMIDFHASFAFPLSVGNATFTSTFSNLFGGTGQPCLPRCTNLEVVSIEVLDENGNCFARPGVWLRP